MEKRDSLLSRLGRRLPNIDWSRRDTKDAVVIFGSAIVGFFIVIRTSLYEAVDAFVVKHDAWHLDDLLMISAIMSIALIAFGYRRFKDLSKEIGARGNAEQEAHRLAHHDPLTGLPNRRFFGKTLEETLLHLGQHDHAAVLMLDLDGFKAVNDIFANVK